MSTLTNSKAADLLSQLFKEGLNIQAIQSVFEAGSVMISALDDAEKKAEDKLKGYAVEPESTEDESSWTLHIKWWRDNEDKLAIIKKLRGMFVGLGYEEARDAVSDLDSAIAIGPRRQIGLLETELYHCAAVETEIEQTSATTGPEYSSKCVFSSTIPHWVHVCRPKHWF